MARVHYVPGLRQSVKIGMAKASLNDTFQGMHVLVLENEAVKVSVLLDKGSDIFELVHKPTSIDLIWHSPIGYRNPLGHPQDGASAGDVFLDFYGGGWNDIFPNYGKQSTNRGASFVGHGESPLLPWTCSDVQEEKDRVSARLSMNCVRYPVRAEKVISLDSSTGLLRISEDLINLSDQAIEVTWAQHIAYGEPFIDEQVQIEIPADGARTHTSGVKHSRLVSGSDFNWPLGPGLNGKVDLSKIPKRSENVEEDFPILELRSPMYRLYNPRLGVGVEVRWNKETYPYLWYWLNWGVPDYPYFGAGRTLALEPTTSTSGEGLAEDIKNGSAKVIEPNSRIHADLNMKIFGGK